MNRLNLYQGKSHKATLTMFILRKFRVIWSGEHLFHKQYLYNGQPTYVKLFMYIYTIISVVQTHNKHGRWKEADNEKRYGKSFFAINFIPTGHIKHQTY